PVARVQVQHAGGLGEEIRGAGEDPVFVLPRLDGVGIEDAPDRRAANRFAQFRLGDLGEVTQRLAAQGRLRLSYPLASKGRDQSAVEGGKKRLYAPDRVGPEGRTALVPNAAARDALSWGAVRRAPRPRRWRAG